MTQKLELRPTVISEKSLIPLSFALILLAGVLRVENIDSRADAISVKTIQNEKEIESLKREDKESRKILTDAIIESNNRLSRIEGAMGINKQ